jgi:hypothetical protein
VSPSDESSPEASQIFEGNEMAAVTPHLVLTDVDYIATSAHLPVAYRTDWVEQRIEEFCKGLDAEISDAGVRRKAMHNMCSKLQEMANAAGESAAVILLKAIRALESQIRV